MTAASSRPHSEPSSVAGSRPARATAPTFVGWAMTGLALLGACATGESRRELTPDSYPGVLRQPSELPFDVVWQQHVTASWGEGQQRGFDAALQKQGDALTLVGLSPVGSVGFVIRLDEGGAIDVTNNTSEDLPFPARFILLDAQRAFFPWGVGGAGAERSATVDGERVTERWRDGQLQERRFERPDREGAIVVHYEWGDADWRGPRSVRLENQWFGYELHVDNQVESVLPAGGA